MLHDLPVTCEKCIKLKEGRRLAAGCILTWLGLIKDMQKDMKKDKDGIMNAPTLSTGQMLGVIALAKFSVQWMDNFSQGDVATPQEMAATLGDEDMKDLV